MKASLDSVLGQSYSNFDIFAIMDDISDYKSLAVLNKYMKEGHPITLYRIDSRGWQGCLTYYNDCMPMAKGNYLMFLDDDDVYMERSHFDNMANIILQHSPKLIMTRMKQVVAEQERIIPPDEYWEKVPVMSTTSTQNPCVLKEEAVKHVWGPTSCGDYDFVHSLVTTLSPDDIYWYDRVVVGTVMHNGSIEY